MEGVVIPTWWKDVDTIIVGLIALILIAVFFGTDRKQKKLRRG
jgi:glucose uptake protein GlcU